MTLYFLGPSIFWTSLRLTDTTTSQKSRLISDGRLGRGCWNGLPRQNDGEAFARHALAENRARSHREKLSSRTFRSSATFAYAQLSVAPALITRLRRNTTSAGRRCRACSPSTSPSRTGVLRAKRILYRVALASTTKRSTSRLRCGCALRVRAGCESSEDDADHGETNKRSDSGGVALSRSKQHMFAQPSLGKPCHPAARVGTSPSDPATRLFKSGMIIVSVP
jgi:hypothetical protein